MGNEKPFWQKPAFAIILLAIIALGFNWVYVTGGFWGDDFFFLNILRHAPDSFSRLMGVWTVKNYPAFEHIWWKDGHWDASFWRPVPSLIIELSVKLFGENPFPLHLLLILLHAAVTVTVYLFVRRLTDQNFLAFLSALFYVGCEDHTFVVCWIATMTDPLCVLFIMLSLLAHLSWLKNRKPVSLISSIILLILALASKETAVIAPIVIIMVTVFFPRGREEENWGWKKLRSDIKAKIKDLPSWLPALIVLIVYFTFYKAFNIGEMNNLGYINPLDDPIKYLSHAVVHLPFAWFGTLTVFPPFWAWLLPGILPYLSVMGAVLFIIWITALLPFKNRPLAWWALLVYSGAMLPQICTDFSDRAMYLPMIPAGILLALLASSIGLIARRIKAGAALMPRWTRFVGWLMIITVLIPGIIMSATGPYAMIPGFEMQEREMLTAMSHLKQHNPEHVLLLNTSSFLNTFYTWDIINFYSDRIYDIWLLSSAHGVFFVEKTGDSSFVISIDREGWLNNFFALLMRSEPQLEVGRVYDRELFAATILETTADRTDVLSVRFDLKYPLDYPGWLFLKWNGRKFVPVDMDALPIGEKILLAKTPDLWEVFMKNMEIK